MKKNRNIKIAHIITRLIEGGAQESVLLTTKYLTQKGFDVYLISGSTSGPEGHISLDRIRNKVKFFIIPELVREIDLFRDPIALIKLYSFIRRNNFDIVHTHTSKAGILGRLAAKLAKVPIIIHTPHGHLFYGYYGRFKTKCFIWLERAVAGITSCIITLTEVGKKEHVAFGIAGPEKFRVVKRGINIETFLTRDEERICNLRKGLNLTRDKKIVGTVARLVPVKGHPYFIDAAQKVVSEIPESRFMVIGDGRLRGTLEKLVQKRNLSDYFYFLGLRNDVPDLLALFDVFVLSSLNEGMGRVIVEAMAAAKPVVATKVGGIPEVVLDGDTGVLVRPRDEDELAKSIISLLKDKERSKTMGEAGRRRAKKAFSEDIMIRKIDEIYTGFLTNLRKT